MKLRSLFALTLAAAALATLPALGALGAEKAAAAASVTGEVIDSACFIKSGAKGEGHVKCAQACADAGIPLAILDDKTHNVVWVAAKEDAKSSNEKLKPFAGQKVTAKGTWAERGGAKLLVLESVTAAPAAK